MHISNDHLDEVRTQGFTVMEGFVEPDLLQAAQNNLWEIYPRPDDYFRDPEQAHHRDYGGHTLAVTKEAEDFRMMTNFILLSDITADTGPTKVVSLDHTRHFPRHLGEIEPERDPVGPFGEGTFTDVEVAITGTAGSIFIYHPDVVHRGTALLGDEVSRFGLLVDYSPVRRRWTGKQSWPTHAASPLWKEPFIAMTPYERTLFGFPGVDDDFWDEQTIRDTANRYAGMDMTPYDKAMRQRKPSSFVNVKEGSGAPSRRT